MMILAHVGLGLLWWSCAIWALGEAYESALWGRARMRCIAAVAAAWAVYLVEVWL